jgi:hypothetical protein
MLREHAQIWGTMEALERAVDAGTASALTLRKRLNVQLLHHKPERGEDSLPTG